MVQRFVRNFLLNEYAFYLSDKWKVLPRLTLTLGLRWQLPGVADERDSLELGPKVQGSAVQTLLSDATLDFIGGSAGRPWYRRDYKEFAPNFGFAWDVFGNGHTALRGGYSINWVNDQAIVAPETMLETNAGAAADGGRYRTDQPRLYRFARHRGAGVQGAAKPERQSRAGSVHRHRAHRPEPAAPLRAAVQRRHPAPVEATPCSKCATWATTWWAAYRAFDFNQVILRAERLPGRFHSRAQQRLSGAGAHRHVQSCLQREHPRQPAAHRLYEDSSAAAPSTMPT